MAPLNLQALLIIIAAVPLISADAGYGLCSEVYQMHQYCTRATSELENVPSVEHTRVTEGRVGKQGPRGIPGPRAIVNYTVIDEEISKKIHRAEKRIDAKFLEFEKSLNKSQEKIMNLIAKNEEIESRVEYERFLNESLQAKINGVYPVDCENVSHENAKVWDVEGGVFDIYPKSRRNSVQVYCDLTTDGGGWTVFQRRMDGSVDFYRNWIEYVNGFGYSDKEMWLGLEKIYQLTKEGEYELRVDLGDWEGNTAYAKFGEFSIANSADNYRLTVGQYSGTAGDSLRRRHNEMQFSTHDQPHDRCGGSQNCAESRNGAWWYECCHNSNLNGMYYRGGKYSTSLGQSCVVWFNWRDDSYYSLKFTEMKFRKKN